MRATFVYAWVQFKSFLRDPVSLFFTLGLPAIFLLVFGAIFYGDNAVNFDVAIFNHSDSAFSKEFVKNMEKEETFTRVEVSSMDEAKEKMGRGQLDTVIELPESFGQVNAVGQPSGEMIVYYEKGNPTTGQTVAQVMSSVMSQMGEQFGQTKPLFSVTQKATDTNVVSQFDYLFAGILGFAVLSLGFFGLAQMIPGLKKTGALRRLKATPFTSGQLIFGTMLYFLVVGAMALVLMIVIGLTVFHFDMRGSWLQLAPFLLLGTMMMLGFGLLIGGSMRNENQAAALTNLVAFPMMFLSGVFIPNYIMPDWIQSVSHYLPLTPFVDGIRFITSEGAGFVDILPQVAMLGGWTVVVYILAIKFFRWE